jgi:hypothetical protein
MPFFTILLVANIITLLTYTFAEANMVLVIEKQLGKANAMLL